MREKPHVVICAVACHPDHGSELAVGWQWVLRAAERYRVTVITAESRGNRPAIESYRKMHPEFADATRFVFLKPFDAPASLFLRKLRHHVPIFYYRAYRQWLKEAAFAAARIVRDERVDCVHQLTYITFREPGFLMNLTVPFIWGPIGGTQNVPWRFLASLGVINGLKHAARNVINELQFRFRLDVASGFRSAAVLSAVASDTQKMIKTYYSRDSVVIPATACSLPTPYRPARDATTETVRFVFSGAFIARKGLPFGLEALASLRDLDWTLDVLGRGPLDQRWRSLASRLGISQRVQFHGGVLRARALEIMAQADALVFPSLQEGWPTVVMESLALGVPVITTDHHGMADMVTPECGVLIPVTNPRQLVRDLATTLRDFIESPDLRQRLSAGALHRGSFFSADNQAAAIHRFYETAISARDRLELK